VRLEQEDQAAESDNREGDIRDDISEIGDAKPGALVCEVVVSHRLRDRWEQHRTDRDHDCDREQ
jgi:hypothetical protein